MACKRSKSLHGIQDKLTVTKTGLQEEDFEVTKKLRSIKIHYDHMYQIVHDLFEEYSTCMNSFKPALTRYIKLKSMIKKCIERFKEKTESVYDTLETTSGWKALMGKNAEIITITSDYGTLHKAELKEDISKKKQEIDRIQAHTNRLRSAVEQLQRDFNISKNFRIVHRYKLLKEMVTRAVEEMHQCHNPLYELQWVETDTRSNAVDTERPFFYLRSRSFSL